MSDQRRDEKPERDRVVVLTLKRAGYRCEAERLVPEVECRGGLDCDEIVLRSGYKGGHLDPANTQSACRAHHDWKHVNPKEAERRGLRVWSWDRAKGSPRDLAAEAAAAWLEGSR